MSDVRLNFLESLKPYELLQELLASIHGDGGHYCAQYGPARAVLAAEDKWYEVKRAALQSPDAPTSDSVSGG